MNSTLVDQNFPTATTAEVWQTAKKVRQRYDRCGNKDEYEESIENQFMIPLHTAFVRAIPDGSIKELLMAEAIFNGETQSLTWLEKIIYVIRRHHLEKKESLAAVAIPTTLFREFEVEWDYFTFILKKITSELLDFLFVETRIEDKHALLIFWQS